MAAKDRNYYEQVFEVTKQIPFGRVSTYGHIADFLALGSARMVGWALHQSSFALHIPAHRVVNHKGELTGRHAFPTPSYMQEMLEQEGIEVTNNRIKNFKEKLWIPAEHLL